MLRGILGYVFVRLGRKGEKGRGNWFYVLKGASKLQFRSGQGNGSVQKMLTK